MTHTAPEEKEPQSPHKRDRPQPRPTPQAQHARALSERPRPRAAPRRRGRKTPRAREAVTPQSAGGEGSRRFRRGGVGGCGSHAPRSGLIPSAPPPSPPGRAPGSGECRAHLDALIAGAGGHPAPVEVERHIVDEVLVVRRDAARHKHGRRRLPGPPPRGRRCGPQPPDHRGGTYGTSALACPPASAPARHAPRDTPCAGGACVRTSLQQQTKLGDGGWKSESTFRGQPGGMRLRKHVIRAQS